MLRNFIFLVKVVYCPTIGNYHHFSPSVDVFTKTVSLFSTLLFKKSPLERYKLRYMRYACEAFHAALPTGLGCELFANQTQLPLPSLHGSCSQAVPLKQNY